MQTDNHNFRKNVVTEKEYVLRKMSLKFQNVKPDISYKIAFYVHIYFYKFELFGVKRPMRQKHKWLNKIVCFNFIKS